MSNDIIQHGQPGQDNLRTYTMIVYALYALSLVSGITAPAGVIMAYLKRADAAGTVYQSHLQYLIKTFWYGLLGMAVGWITLFVLIGFLIMAVVGVWFVYRIVAGFVKLCDNKPVSAEGWL